MQSRFRQRVRFVVEPTVALGVSLVLAGTGTVSRPVATAFAIAYALVACHVLVVGLPLPRWLLSLARAVPGLGGYVELDRQFLLNRSVVGQMLGALAWYGVPQPDPPAVSGFEAELPAHDLDSSRIQGCAHSVAAWMAAQGLPGASAPLIELLHLERNGGATTQLWPGRRSELTPPLAELLARFGCDASLARSASALAKLLPTLDTFSGPDAKQERSILGSLVEAVNGFGVYLRQQGLLAKEGSLGPDEVLAGVGVGQGLRARDPDELRLAALQSAWKAWVSLPDPAEGEALGLLALALHLEATPGARSAVCRKAAQSQAAVELTFAYVDLAEPGRTTEAGRDAQISLGVLQREWKSRLERRRRELGQGVPKELKEIRTGLARGVWPPDQPAVLRGTFDTIERESRIQSPLSRLARARPGVLATLRRVFGKLSRHTIERFLGARRVDAYLLTFDAGQGKVAPLLNCLVMPDREADLEKLGVCVREEGRRFYAFKQYTPSARVGLVPSGVSFADFTARLSRDLEKVFGASAQLLPALALPTPHDVEVIAHRFGIVGHNYEPVETSVSAPRAVARLQELLAESLDPETQITLFEYEQRIDLVREMAEEAQFAELIGDVPADVGGVPTSLLTQAERDQLLRQDDRVRGALRAALGTSGRAGEWSELGERYRAGGVASRAIETAAQAVAAEVGAAAPNLGLVGWRLLVGAYLETLAALAEVHSA